MGKFKWPTDLTACETNWMNVLDVMKIMAREDMHRWYQKHPEYKKFCYLRETKRTAAEEQSLEEKRAAQGLRQKRDAAKRAEQRIKQLRVLAKDGVSKKWAAQNIGIRLDSLNRFMNLYGENPWSEQK